MEQTLKSFLSASLKAEEIIRGLQIRNPSEILILEIAMERGAFVNEKHLEGYEASLTRKGRLGIISVNKSIPEEGRKRFAIAHELGHFELHAASQIIFCAEDDMFVWNENKEQEIEANEFAANLLMPRDIFMRYLKPEQPNMDSIIELADKFRTTLTATALRYVQLSPEPCAVAISKDGVIKWYSKSPGFDFHIKVGENLGKSTVEAASNPAKVPASAWLAGDIDEHALIYEQSLTLRGYGVMISLLWLCDQALSLSSRLKEDETEFDLTNPFTPDGKRWRW